MERDPTKFQVLPEDFVFSDKSKKSGEIKPDQQYQDVTRDKLQNENRELREKLKSLQPKSL